MRIVDRYITKMVVMYVLAAVFAFAVLIICNNFYASSKLLFREDIPFKLVAMINLLDAPATLVLSLPVASLFGVMLAIGQLGRSSELTAMRCGGISLFRIMVPILILSLFISYLTYYIDENVVPKASKKAFELKSAIKGEEGQLNIKQNLFFRDDMGKIIHAAIYDTDTHGLVRITVFEREDEGRYRITPVFTGRFDGDFLVINNGRSFLFDSDGELTGRDPVREERILFERKYQKIHEEKRDASTLAGGEISEQISWMQDAGMDPIAERTELNFKKSIPVACFIFTFVGFIFSVHSPRKETFMGMLYAIILVLIYYVLISVFKSLGKQGIIPYPLISAWATNAIFLLYGMYIFTRIRR